MGSFLLQCLRFLVPLGPQLTLSFFQDLVKYLQLQHGVERFGTIGGTGGPLKLKVLTLRAIFPRSEPQGISNHSISPLILRQVTLHDSTNICTI